MTSITETDYAPHEMTVPGGTLRVKDFYRGKNIFITGTTGFLGKVILEKIMRTCPDFNKIYLMVRPKRNMDLMNRVNETIFSSHCFSVVKRQYGGELPFHKTFANRIIPIQGDLVSEKLGISEADRAMLTNEVDIIINSAASVNFNDPLQDAIRINYFGATRILELAKECKKLEVLTHVSTAYVNCCMKGYIDEEIYDCDTDVEVFVKRIMSMSLQDVQAQEEKLLEGFPNTYTFTKNMAEKYILQKKEHVKTCIWRPAIIACAQSEPIPGWTDSISAAGALTILGGFGILRYLPGKGDTPLDVIPVDTVSNGLLVATAHAAQSEKSIHIYNCASSVQNPMLTYDYSIYCKKGFRYLGLNQRSADNIDLLWVDNPLEYKVRVKMHFGLPVKMISIASQLPYFGTEQLKKQAKDLKKIESKFNSSVGVFEFFIFGDWKIENKKIYKLIDMLSPEEKAEFQCDIRTVEWYPLVRDYIKGMAIWVLKEDQVSPEHGLVQIMLKNQAVRTDMMETMFPKAHFIEKNSLVFEKAINNYGRFNNFMQTEALAAGAKLAVQSYPFNSKAIKAELQRVRVSITNKSTRFVYYSLCKIGRRLVDGLHVDINGLNKMKELASDRKCRVVLVPTYKSYADPLILHFINFNQDVEPGFTFGNFEDSPKIHFVDMLLRRIGCLLIKRREQHDMSINYVNQSLLQDVIESNSITTVFQNDERPRSGKFSLPMCPDNMIKSLIKVSHYLKRMKISLKIVPVTINYDRVFDVNWFAEETMTGRLKPGTTMFNVANKMMKMNRGKLGKVFVKYLDALDVQEYISSFSKPMPQTPQTWQNAPNLDFEKASMELTKHLYFSHQREWPFTMNSVMAASLIYQPQESIQFAKAMRVGKQLYDYIQTKDKFKCYISYAPQNYDIKEAATHLGFSVQGQPMDRHKGGQAFVNLENKKNVETMLQLAYYGNHLAMYFSRESFLIHTLLLMTGYNKVNPQDVKLHEGEFLPKVVTLSELKGQCQIPFDIFHNEFLPLHLEPFTDALAKKLMAYAEHNSILRYDEEKDTIQIFNKASAIKKLIFIKELTQSFVDTYFIVGEALCCLMERRATLDQSQLTRELFNCVKILYYNGHVRYLNSCHQETIEAAFARFAEMGLCDRQVYSSNNGQQTVYLRCSQQQAEGLDIYLKTLQKMTSCQGREKDVDNKINSAITQAQGPMARL